jgi:AAA15 family ATPase/GTPase
LLKTLRIKNFKGWEDTGTIEIAPITLFLGGNSSGKSSIGQLLVLLKQSVLSPERKSPLVLHGSSEIIDFGLPLDILFGRDLNRCIEFEYQWDNEFKIADDINNKTYVGNRLGFSSVVKVNDAERQNLEVERFAYSLYFENEKLLSLGMQSVQKIGSTTAYKAISEQYGLKRHRQGRKWEMPSPINFYGFPDQMRTYHQNASFIYDLNKANEELLLSISYLGPLRKRAERAYRWAGSYPESVGSDGNEAIFAFLTAEEEKRRYNFKEKQHTQDFKLVMANALKEMGLVQELDIKKIDEDRQDYDVKVKPKGSIEFSYIPDVGFGISQVLPVIVQLFYAPSNSIIIMEQPELHLHPSAQSALADVMIDAIKSRENGQRRNIQLIIETHSEHFLRRFQRRIAEGVLEKDQFSAYFANNDNMPASLEPLQVNLFGDIINWPRNFFGDLDGDILLQTRASINKKLGK